MLDTKIFTEPAHQAEVKKTAQKEKEVFRLIQVKSEKLCNMSLIKNDHTQLSHLTKEEQTGAIAVPKGIILDKIIAFLQRL